jgi:hypothetical protein
MKYIIVQMVNGKEWAYYRKGTGSEIEYHFVKSFAKRFDNIFKNDEISDNPMTYTEELDHIYFKFVNNKVKD